VDVVAEGPTNSAVCVTMGGDGCPNAPTDGDVAGLAECHGLVVAASRQ
jgi:hypothetical protein